MLSAMLYEGKWLERVIGSLVFGVLMLLGVVSCRQGGSIDGGASGQALLDAVKVGDSQTVSLLLVEGVYMEVRDERGDTPIMYAVKTGNLQVVRMMLQQDVDRHARSGDGKGLLEMALDSGNKDMVLCLLGGGVSPDELGRDGDPLLLKAVRYREMDTLKLLLKSGVNASAAGKDGQTALHIAAEEGMTDYMDVLLAMGANPDVANDSGVTPLWVGLNLSGPVDRWQTMGRLLKAGADVNVSGPRQQSMLIGLIERNLMKEAVELINYGADVNLPNSEGVTPIQIADAKGDDAMVAMLLSRGARGDALLDKALQEEDIEMVRLLFAFGIRPKDWARPEQKERRYRKGKDSIIAACVRKGQLSLAELYLQHGADARAPGREGQEPLHMAIAMRDVSMVKLLLEYGANPNVYFSRPVSKDFLAITEKESTRWFLRNERKLTPLMMAANNGDLPVLTSLIDYGARRFVYSGRHHLYPVNFASRRSDVKAMQIILGQNPDKEIYHAVLDLSDQRVKLYDAKGEVVFSSRVSTGKAGFRTPKGTFVITDKHKKHNSTIYGSSMPYFQRFSCSAFGFHAGNCPGYPASHGCIRMPYSAAKKLFSLTPVGTRVVIQP